MKTVTLKHHIQSPLKSILGYTLAVLLLFTACEDFVTVDPPRTDLVTITTFSNEATADAAVLDLYYQMASEGFASGGFQSISFLGSLYSDEQISYYTGSLELTAQINQFNNNSLAPDNNSVRDLWGKMYKCIYHANAVVEGLATSVGISENVKNQLQGEALFVRSFCYFYLVNLFGDVPLVTTTDYRVNATIERGPVAEVYQQIVMDLKTAQDLLPDDYSHANGEKVRANRQVATALLARTYLYMADWTNAEQQATAVIENDGFSLVTDLNEVTEKNNTEAILQFWRNTYPRELFTFYIFSVPIYGALRNEFLADFEVEDKRMTDWIGMSGDYSFSRKHSSFELTEYSTVLRLGEQFLIRAEARAHLDNIAGSLTDVNEIRTRAGLSNLEVNTREELIDAILHERKHELFNEWGHRWFDLKRTGRANEVLAPIKPMWVPTSSLFPIPEYEIRNNASLRNAQNPGY